MNKQTGRPIRIDRTIAKTCFTIQTNCSKPHNLTKQTDCQCPNTTTDNIKIQIKKAGDCNPLIEYLAFDIENDKVCFYWDDLFYNLDKGRYIGQLFINDKPQATVQFDLNNSGLTLTNPTNIKRQQEINCED